MNKTYTLNVEGQEPVEYGSKKTAIKHGDASGLSYDIVSPSGLVVEVVEVPAPDQGQATRTGASARVGVKQPDGVEKEPEPTEEEVALKHTVSITLPGNYSIVTAPGVRDLAVAFGAVAHEVRFAGKLERRVDISSNNKAELGKVHTLVEQALEQALAGLRAWQKENIERRRGLTDMERYLEHRRYLAEYLADVAKTASNS